MTPFVLMYPAYMGYLNWCYQNVISSMLSGFIKPILKKEYHSMSMPSMLCAILFSERQNTI